MPYKQKYQVRPPLRPSTGAGGFCVWCGVLLCAVGAVDLASPAGQPDLVGRVEWVGVGPVRLWLKSWVPHPGVL